MTYEMRNKVLPELKSTESNSELARFCSALSDGTRTQVISALMDGSAQPASAISQMLRMSPQATRFHLRKLEEANMITVRACGRHRYYEIACSDTAERLESVFGIVAPPRSIPEARYYDAAFDQARSCYKHLAGSFAVQIAEGLIQGEFLKNEGGVFDLPPTGQELFNELGINFSCDDKGIVRTKRCIDVTHRRAHIGGQLGRSMLDWMIARKWFRPEIGRRALQMPGTARTEVEHFLSTTKSGRRP